VEFQDPVFPEQRYVLVDRSLDLALQCSDDPEPLLARLYPEL
jgi:hypothetical protein